MAKKKSGKEITKRAEIILPFVIVFHNLQEQNKIGARRTEYGITSPGNLYIKAKGKKEKNNGNESATFTKDVLKRLRDNI